MINCMVETGDGDLKGAAAADHFDCGKGNDEILDFKPSQGDTKTKDCEDFSQVLL
jgi:hypothetical protein